MTITLSVGVCMILLIIYALGFMTHWVLTLPRYKVDKQDVNGEDVGEYLLCHDCTRKRCEDCIVYGKYAGYERKNKKEMK